MDTRKPDFVKALALLISAAALFFGGYQGISTLMNSRSEGRARAIASKVLPRDGLEFGRFNDFGHGVSCLEFTILRERKTKQYGAVIIMGEDRAESRQKVRAILPSYQECLIEGAG
jgi:hypothetical protein